MRPLRPIALGAVVLLAAYACGNPPSSTEDAGQPVEEDAGASTDTDAGELDAGKPDAGKPDAGPVDAGFGPFAVDQWCDMLALARCARLERCLSLSGEQFAACTAREGRLCDQAAYTSGVENGRLQYLPQEAANCINAYGTGACTGEPAACGPVFEGLVGPEGACLSVEDCESGTYCLTYANTCPFTCYGYRAVGQPCNWWDQQCDPNESTCTSTPSGQRCVALKNSGDTCVYWSDCRPELACINEKCVQRTARLGEACALTQGYPYCETDTFCRTEPSPSGEPDGGVCMKRAGLGGVCAGYGSCQIGLRCSSNYTTGTCIPLGKVNDTCTNYDDCQSELYCSPPLSRCLPLPTDGGDCGTQGSFFRCAAGYFCEYPDDVCKPLKALGESCSYDGLCDSNTCDYGPLGDGGNGNRCIESCSVRVDGGF